MCDDNNRVYLALHKIQREQKKKKKEIKISIGNWFEQEKQNSHYYLIDMKLQAFTDYLYSVVDVVKWNHFIDIFASLDASLWNSHKGSLICLS